MSFSLMDLWSHAGLVPRVLLVVIALVGAGGLLAGAAYGARVLVGRRGTVAVSGAGSLAWEGALCPEHAVSARGTCARCGAFVCAECPAGPRCGPCEARIQGDGDGAVVAPGLSLAMLGALGFFMKLVVISGARQGGAPAAEDLGTAGEELLSFLMLWLPLLGSLVIAVAGLQMARNRSYGLAIAGAVLAIIPVTNACCGISAGLGIWSLVVLGRSDVKAVFADEREAARRGRG